MTPPSDISEALKLTRLLSDSLLSVVAPPAALVDEDGRVVATNAGWAELVGFQSTAPGPSEPGSREPCQSPVLGECLQGFARIDALLHQLHSGSKGGVLTLLGPQETSMPDAPRSEFVARWRQVEAPYTLVVLAAPEADVSHLVSLVNAQRVSIDNLLIRQTLIEEKERRRLGRALHDGIGQELALIRAQVIRTTRPDDMTTRLVRALDTVIGSVRGLTFELSPPILEDLGILPALHWLAESLGERYGTHIAVADDASEPRLSAATRVIVFRAVRELAINAVKYAGDAEIIISSVTGLRTARFSVRDTGRGIDVTAVHPSTDGARRFGLLSVEQQIRGIGGTFEIVSSVGEGTRAIINVPVEVAEGAAHG